MKTTNEIMVQPAFNKHRKDRLFNKTKKETELKNQGR